MPESPVALRVVATVFVPAAVKRPSASTVKFGIAVVEPYEPAVTAVFFNSNGNIFYFKIHLTL